MHRFGRFGSSAPDFCACCTWGKLDVVQQSESDLGFDHVVAAADSRQVSGCGGLSDGSLQ